MQKFQILSAIAAPFPKKNVDTDTIIRIERCTGTPREEIGKYAFEMARFLKDGGENPDFVLNRPRYRGAKILVCGEFFGTGSSREMAVWALAGMGIRALIAPSYGQIFYSNCFQNGLLPLVLPSNEVDGLMKEAYRPRPPGYRRRPPWPHRGRQGRVRYHVSPWGASFPTRPALPIAWPYRH